MPTLKTAATAELVKEFLRRAQADLAELQAVPGVSDEAKQRAASAVAKLEAVLAERNKKEETMSESTKTILAGYDSRPNVKGVQSLFKTTRVVGKHHKTGAPIASPFLGGNEACLPSEWDAARIGTWAKHLARRTPGLGHLISWSETEGEILKHILNECSFSGEVGGEYVQGIRGERTKAVLDDTTSGGSYLNPDFFDASVVVVPLLFGELVPWVDQVNVPRGSTVAGAVVGTPTAVWNTSEGTSQDLFSTTGLITSLSHTIHPLAVFIELGRDALADSMVNLGQVLAQNIGMRFQYELDRVVATGDGSTQPEGLATATGVNSLTAANGTAGPLTVGDAEQLMFGIDKPYRQSAYAPAFISTDEGYRRFRSVAVNASSDARRVFGMDHAAYTLFDYPCRINGSLTEGTFIFAALRKAYRLFRRQGMEIRFTQEGSTMMRQNTVLLACRGRWGGGVVDAAGVAKFTNGPTTG